MESGFYHDQTLSCGSNQLAISFKPSVVDSTREVIMMGDYYRMNNNNNNVSSMVFSGNSGMVYSGSVYTQIGNSSTSNVSDSVAGLKHDAGLAVEWSAEEQCKLEERICKQDLISICKRRGGSDALNLKHNEWLHSVQLEPDVITMSFIPITSLLNGVSGSGYLSHAINLYL